MSYSNRQEEEDSAECQGRAVKHGLSWGAAFAVGAGAASAALSFRKNPWWTSLKVNNRIMFWFMAPVGAFSVASTLELNRCNREHQRRDAWMANNGRL
jgi:hypothetical protein